MTPEGLPASLTRAHTHTPFVINLTKSEFWTVYFVSLSPSLSVCTNSIHDIAIPRFPKSTSQAHICHTHNALPWQPLPILYSRYWIHECARAHTHTFSQMRAALYTILFGKCQGDFNPLNDTRVGLQWNLCRNQSKTDQCLICRCQAVTALIHRKSPPTENTFVPPSCPGVYSLSIIQHHII